MDIFQENGKTSWPECENMDSNQAMELIKNENPSLEVIILSTFTPVTRDYRPFRVRIFEDKETHLVQGIPRTG